MDTIAYGVGISKVCWPDAYDTSKKLNRFWKHSPNEQLVAIPTGHVPIKADSER